MDIAGPDSEFNILGDNFSAEEIIAPEFKCENEENESCTENVEYIEWKQSSIEEFIVPNEEPQLGIFPTNEISAKKRKKNPSLRKTSMRRKKRESEQRYITTTDKLVPGRALKKPCSNCIFGCTNVFSAEERIQIFESFWGLSDDEKNNYYNKFVSRDYVSRRKKDCDSSIKQFSYKYFFEKNQSLHRVCRVFFLSTLSIDQNRIYYNFTHLKNEEIQTNSKQKRNPINIKRLAALDNISEIKKHFSIPSSANKILLPKQRKKNLTCKAHLQRPKIEIGHVYVSTKNELEPGRDIREPCNNCTFKCANVFSAEERTKIFQSFWSLSDSDRNSFYNTFVTRDYVKRRRKNSRSYIKQFSYKYFLEKNQTLHRVCRVFFLNTLRIDQKRVYYCFKHLRLKDEVSPVQRIKKKRVTKPDLKTEIPEQILCSSEASPYYSTAKLSSDSEPQLTRKRNIKASLWKVNFRKLKRETEQTYDSKKKEIVPGRALKKPCSSCPYSCTNIFSTKDRIDIFQLFWSLSGAERIHFYNKFVIRGSVKRRKKTSQSDIKQFSYKYFLEKNGCLCRVCRVFFLNTLCIDQKRIYYSFKHLKDKCTPYPLQISNGTAANHGSIPGKRTKIEEQILSISTLRSHYYHASVPSISELVPAKEWKKNPLLHETILRKLQRDPGQTIVPANSKVIASEDIKESIQNYTSESEQTIETEIAFGDIKESVEELKSKSEQKIESAKTKTFAVQKIQKQNSETGPTIVSAKRKLASGRNIKEMTPKQAARSMKEPCKNCPFECVNIFSTEERNNIFQSFWSLSGDERTSFYNKFVIRDNVKRRKKDSQSDIKQFSYKYFLEKSQALQRVCRVFFLHTLSIDQKRIYYSFNHLQNKDSDPLL